MASERRKHARVPAAFPCVMMGPDRKHESFDVLDLSESGVRMRCARSLAPMTQIQVSLELPAARTGRPRDVKLMTRGVVVWSHREARRAGAKGEPAEAAYDTGVFFPELTGEQRAMLLLFVASAVS
jgi:PilZ domain